MSGSGMALVQDGPRARQRDEKNAAQRVAGRHFFEAANKRCLCGFLAARHETEQAQAQQHHGIGFWFRHCSYHRYFVEV